MKQQPAQLCLKPGVTLTEQDGQIGLAHNGLTRLARDGTQAALLRALARNPMDLDPMWREDTSPPDDMPLALTLAALILDFGDYLEP